MEDLYQLVKGLNKSGYRSVRKLLLEYGKKRQKNNLLDDLFVLLYNSTECPTREECSRQLWKEPNSAALRIVKSRVKKRILEYLAHDLNVNRGEKQDESVIAELRIRKKWVQFLYLVRTKGSDKVSADLLEHIIEQSKEFEFYYILCEALQFKKYMKGICKGKSDFEKVNRQIEYAERCSKAVNQANDLYYEMIMWEGFNGKTDTNEVVKFLKKSISELNIAYQETQSNIVLYYQKLLEISYCQELEDFELASKVCDDLYKTLIDSKAIFRKGRLGILLGNNAKFKILSGSYIEGVRLAKKALDHFEQGTINYSITKEQMFYGFFYNQSYDDALKIVKELSSELKIKSDFRIAQYHFFEASICFQKGEFHKSMVKLRENLEIVRDKIGWGIAIRLLRIMNMVEMNKTDQAVAEIETLRKHMERHSIESINVREKQILKLLRLIEKKGFKFSELNDHEIRLLNNLGTDPRYKWKPFMPELIPFQEWMLSRYNDLGKHQRSLVKNTHPRPNSTLR